LSGFLIKRPDFLSIAQNKNVHAAQNSTPPNGKCRKKSRNRRETARGAPGGGAPSGGLLFAYRFQLALSITERRKRKSDFPLKKSKEVFAKRSSDLSPGSFWSLQPAEIGKYIGELTGLIRAPSNVSIARG
jgi:hypothetical protein